jgi:hypothetical protein
MLLINNNIWALYKLFDLIKIKIVIFVYVSGLFLLIPTKQFKHSRVLVILNRLSWEYFHLKYLIILKLERRNGSACFYPEWA